MSSDFIDFDVSELYFDESISDEASLCIDKAADHYGDRQAECHLMRAYFLEPQHPVVLVALYRFYYYQHSYVDALLIAERVLSLYAIRLGLPARWQELNQQHVDTLTRQSMVELRFYLLALKGAGYLELRLETFEPAIERLQKVVELDQADRLGAASLLEIAQDEINRKAGIYRLKPRGVL